MTSTGPAPERKSIAPEPDSKPGASVPEHESVARSPEHEPAAAAPHLQFPKFWWLVGWALVLFIIYSTLAPAVDVPNLHIWDKLEHAGAFFGLSMWFGGLIRRRRYPLLAFWMVLFGAGIELAQGYMSWGRDMDWHDIVADSTGVGVALVLLCAGLSQWAVVAERILGLSREPT